MKKLLSTSLALSLTLFNVSNVFAEKNTPPSSPRQQTSNSQPNGTPAKQTHTASSPDQINAQSNNTPTEQSHMPSSHDQPNSQPNDMGQNNNSDNPTEANQEQNRDNMETYNKQEPKFSLDKLKEYISFPLKDCKGNEYTEKELEIVCKNLTERNSELEVSQVADFLKKSKYEKNKTLRLILNTDIHLKEFELPYDYIAPVMEKKLTTGQINKLKDQKVDKKLFKYFICSKMNADEFIEIFKRIGDEKGNYKAEIIKKICECGITSDTMKRIMSLGLSIKNVSKLLNRNFFDDELKLLLDLNLVGFIVHTKISSENIKTYINSKTLVDGLMKRIMEKSSVNEKVAEKLLVDYHRFIFQNIPNNLFEKFLTLDPNDFSYVIHTLKTIPSMVESLNSNLFSKNSLNAVYFLEAAYKNLNENLSLCCRLSLNIQDELWSKIMEQMSPYDMMVRKKIVEEIYLKTGIFLKNKFFTKSVSSWRNAPVNMSETEIRSAIKAIAPESHFDEYLFEKSQYDNVSRYEGIGSSYQKLLQRILLLKDQIIGNEDCHNFIIGQFCNQDSEACKNRLINIIHLCAKTIDNYQNTSDVLQSILTNYRTDMVEKIFSCRYKGYENLFDAFNDNSFGAENMIAYRKALKMPLAIPMDALSRTTEISIRDIRLDQDFVIKALSDNFSNFPLKKYFKDSLDNDELVNRCASSLKVSLRDYIEITRGQDHIFTCLSEIKKNITKAIENISLSINIPENERKQKLRKLYKLQEFTNDFCKLKIDEAAKLLAFLNVTLDDENKSSLDIGMKEMNIPFDSMSVEQEIVNGLFVKDKNTIKKVLTKCFFNELIEEGYLSSLN